MTLYLSSRQLNIYRDLIYISVFTSLGLPAAAIEAVPENCVSTVEERAKEDREKWWKMGLKAIYEGKLGVVLLSGGQVLSLINCTWIWIWILCCFGNNGSGSHSLILVILGLWLDYGLHDFGIMLATYSNYAFILNNC